MQRQREKGQKGRGNEREVMRFFSPFPLTIWSVGLLKGERGAGERRRACGGGVEETDRGEGGEKKKKTEETVREKCKHGI